MRKGLFTVIFIAEYRITIFLLFCFKNYHEGRSFLGAEGLIGHLLVFDESDFVESFLGTSRLSF